MYDFENKPRRSFLKAGLWGVAIILGVSAVGGVGSFAINMLSQPARIAQQTFNADNIIYNYEWFRQQYEDIQAMDLRIANSERQLDNWLASAPARDNWEIQDRQMHNQLNSIVMGMQNHRAQMVANYNGRANMANRSIFMAGLPQYID